MLIAITAAAIVLLAICVAVLRGVGTISFPTLVAPPKTLAPAPLPTPFPRPQR
jgi:hypothetical protein